MATRRLYAQDLVQIESDKVETIASDISFVVPDKDTGPGSFEITLSSLQDIKVNDKRILTTDDLGGVGGSTVVIGTTTTLVPGSSATVVNVGTPINAVLDFGIPRGIDGTNGTSGTNGTNGLNAVVAVGTTTTLAPGTSASVTNTGTPSSAVFNFGIPQGLAGTDGTNGTPGTNGTNGTNGLDAVVAVGTTTTLLPGASATVTNTGTPSSAILNFGIPRGATGIAGVVAIGTTTTLAPGSSATVTNTGTPSSAVFNFGIPQGLPGITFTPYAGWMLWSSALGATNILNNGFATGNWDPLTIGESVAGTFNATNGSFTAPANGTYQITAAFNTNGAGRRMTLSKGTGLFPTRIIQSAAADTNTGGICLFDWPLTLLAGDVIRFQNVDGGTITIAGRPNNTPSEAVSVTRMSVFRLL